MFAKKMRIQMREVCLGSQDDLPLKFINCKRIWFNSLTCSVVISPALIFIRNRVMNDQIAANNQRMGATYRVHCLFVGLHSHHKLLEHYLAKSGFQCPDVQL
ncbi:hypothetical protein ACS0TY_013851 [Phlomoides rotata]